MPRAARFSATWHFMALMIAIAPIEDPGPTGYFTPATFTSASPAGAALSRTTSAISISFFLELCRGAVARECAAEVIAITFIPRAFDPKATSTDTGLMPALETTIIETCDPNRQLA